MKLHLHLTAAASVLIGLPAQAAVLASYQFTSASPAATSSAADLTASNFSFNSALIDGTKTGFSTGGNIFARVQATTASELAEAITENQYVTVTMTPDAGFQLDLTSLTVDLGYSESTTTIVRDLSASVFSSVDGFSAPDVLGTITNTTAVFDNTVIYQNLDIDLTGAAYQGLTGPLEFRIYLYDNEPSTSATQPIHRIDNFTLNGAVAVIPEPSSAAMLGLIGCGLLLRRRRVS